MQVADQRSAIQNYGFGSSSAGPKPRADRRAMKAMSETSHRSDPGLPRAVREPPGKLGHVRSLFSTPEWFSIWSESFGGDTYGAWSSSGPQRCVIPYVTSKLRWGGIMVARGAANAHTPRYD